jgi:hypothetical protein
MPRLIRIIVVVFAFSAQNNLLHKRGMGVGKKEKAKKSLRTDFIHQKIIALHLPPVKPN